MRARGNSSWAKGESTMRIDPVYRPFCPHCGACMMLARITPNGEGAERRLFECPRCDDSVDEIVEVEPAAQGFG
jgi:ribosomal protein S27AE